MKREIKFKAKRLDNGEWCEGYFYEENGNTYIIENRQKESMLNRNVTYEVNTFTVCQFTGLKDCDGTPIYEQDLLRSEKTGSIFEVVWNQVNASFSLVDTEYPVLYPTNTLGRMWRNRKLKVVGNEFENDN